MQIPYPVTYGAKTEEKSMSQVTTADQYKFLPQAFKAAFPQGVYGDDSMSEVAKYVECILGPDATGELCDQAQKILDLTGWSDVCDERLMEPRSGVNYFSVKPNHQNEFPYEPDTKIPFGDMPAKIAEATSVIFARFSGIRTIPLLSQTNLKILRLLRLFEFNYLPRFNSLEELTLSNLTKFTTLPPLPNLKTLSVRFSQGFGEFPSGLSKLPKLEHVTLIDGGFEEIPEELRGVKNLAILRLGNTKISTIPEWLPNNVKILNIDGTPHELNPPQAAHQGVERTTTDAIATLFPTRRGSSWLYNIVLIIVGLALAYFHFSRTQTPAAPQLD